MTRSQHKRQHYYIEIKIRYIVTLAQAPPTKKDCFAAAATATTNKTVNRCRKILYEIHMSLFGLKSKDTWIIIIYTRKETY